MSFAQDLRASVLQAAMQGKLTEQLETDTPVSKLLANIKVEKNRLISEKKIKKEKPLVAISEDDIPFDIPESWEYVRVGDIVSNRAGLSYNKENLIKKSDNMVRVLRGGNIFDGTYSFKPDDVMIDSSFVKSELFLNKNTIITPAVTSLEHIGKMARIEKSFTDTVVGGFVLMLTPHLDDDILSQYLLHVFLEPSFRDRCRNITNKSGQAFYNLSRQKLMELVIPIPPIEEQKRIVRRIEEIMKQIDELEAIEEELKKLKEVFPADMKAAVLQAAMQGKLTEQLETDSSVDDLLENIKKEREKLIAEGKIKRPRTAQNNNFVALDDVPFDIPSSWRWVYLNSIAYANGGYAFQSSKYSKDGTRVVRISDFNNDGLLFNQIVRHPFSKDLEQYTIKVNDILMCMTGGTVGKCCLIDTLPEQMVTNQRVANISSVLVKPKFLHYVLKSCMVQDIIKQNKNSTNDNISMDLILSFPIPLPSIEEQQRIVQKLEAILPLIEGV